MVGTSLGIRYLLLALLLVWSQWSFRTLLVKYSSLVCINHADRFSAVITYVVGSVCSVMMFFVTSNFLDAFAEQLWTVIVSFVMSVCLSAQNGVLPQDRYLCNFIFEIFTKIHEHLILFKIWKKQDMLCIEMYILYNLSCHNWSSWWSR
jgi:hypothetical protein